MAKRTVQKVIQEIIAKDMTKQAVTSVGAGFNKLRGLAASTGKTIQGAFGMLPSLMAQQAINYISASLREGSRSAVDFNKAMAEVSTLVDTSVVSMSAMTHEVERQSLMFGKAATEISKGYYQAISAGIDSGGIDKFMDAANKLAVGGAATTADSVDLLTTAMNAYNLEASTATDVSDMLFQAVKDGKTNITQLAGSLGNVIPIAAQAGLSLEEVLASQVAMTKVGLDNNSAATMLKNVLANIVSPTEQAAQAMKKYNIELSLSKLQQEGLIGVLQEIKTKTAGDLSIISELFPNIRAQLGAAALDVKFEDYAASLKRMREEAGQAETAFAKMAGSTAVKMERLGNAFDEGKKAIGEEFNNAIVNAMGSGREFDSNLSSIVATFKGIANAGIGAVKIVEKVHKSAMKHYAPYRGFVNASSWIGEKLGDYGRQKEIGATSVEEALKVAKKRPEDIVGTNAWRRAHGGGAAAAEEEKAALMRQRHMRDQGEARELAKKLEEKRLEIINKQTNGLRQQIDAITKQNQSYKDQLLFMTPLERMQEKAIANMLKTANAAKLGNLSEDIMSKIQGSRFLREQFLHKAEATGYAKQATDGIGYSEKDIEERAQLVASIQLDTEKRTLQRAKQIIDAKAKDDLYDYAESTGGIN